MARLFVRVRDGERQPVAGVTASWRTPDSANWQEGQAVDGDRIRLADVPDENEFLVQLRRPGAPTLWVSLDLDARVYQSRDFRFVTGKPTVMDLTWTRVRGRRQDPTLHVTWHEPQEVVFCAGRDTHRDGRAVFPGIAVRRFSRMANANPQCNVDAGITQVNRSCVLTLFEFDGENSRVHFALPGRGLVSMGRRRWRAPVAVMRSLTVEEFCTEILEREVAAGQGAPRGSSQRLGITHVYDHLEAIGRDQSRRGTVMGLEFFSHGYWIGPVLENDNRLPRSAQCNSNCPTDLGHRGNFMAMPSQTIIRNGEEIRVGMRLPSYLPTGTECRNSVAVVSHRSLPRGQDHRAPAHAIMHQERREAREIIADQEQREARTLSPEERRSALQVDDRDPRNTDFAPLVMSGTRRDALRAAFHAEQSVLRVWGCNNGDMGPRFRAAVQWLDGSSNELLTIRSSKSGRRQIWRVRRGDVKLHYYSTAHRTYAQAIATMANRPCFATVPGTSACYRQTRRLGGMTVEPSAARMRNFIESLPNFEHRDEAGYYEFSPTVTRYATAIRVLLAGFVPFRRQNGHFAMYNSGQLATERFTAPGTEIATPTWIDLTLQVEREVNVDVVWTCDRSRLQSPDAPARPPSTTTLVNGSAGLEQIVRRVDPDIVVVLGGSGIVRNRGFDIRVEQIARNFGLGQFTDHNGTSRTLIDNAGMYLSRSGEIFSGKPEHLESVIPRRTWANVVQNLMQEGVRVHLPRGRHVNILGDPYTFLNSAGNYICNETFYRLLLESTVGEGRRVPPSGRWVTMVHLAALPTNADDSRREQHMQRLDRALAVLIRTLVEEMLWSRVPYGRICPGEQNRVFCTPD